MMKRFLSIGIALAFIIPLLWGFASGQKEQDKQSLSLEISEYYRSYNFISSFSSQFERETLAAYLSQEKLNSERLEKVFQSMKKVKARVMNTDPKMTIQVKPGGLNIFPSEVIEVRNFKQNGGELMVEVAAYGLKPEENFRYIALYDEHKGNEKEIPSEEEIIDTAKSKFPPRKEIHKWLYVNGQWMKQEANLVFLKDKK